MIIRNTVFSNVFYLFKNNATPIDGFIDCLPYFDPYKYNAEYVNIIPMDTPALVTYPKSFYIINKVLI